MPISKLRIFRTAENPDKIYSKEIGSSYQNQVGPYPSNNFTEFDYKYATRNYKKLDRLVLTQESDILLKHRRTKEGFEFIQEDDIKRLEKDIESGFFHSRYDCETDELVLQPIPYAILFGEDETIFTYVRAKEIRDYGDERLFGKHSIGAGGHIVKTDGPDFLKGCIEREVLREEVKIEGRYTKPQLVGTLMAYEQPVDRVHFGLVYAIHTNGNVRPNEAALISGKMVKINNILEDKSLDKKFETWSRILMPSLKAIYKISKQTKNLI